ncbi:hypothetical protein BDD43_3392 [Mucilaginibacter gracilis]|uniref:Uncharacterized protein n=1 Tax=Mucilaginibacter gracilis TaxID=423350 RepID=A0A495J2J8_9SPHI|nr:hypothetical protein [Mucilaginibacter gracilis]RKR83190.1 hypothetical protein BDD43_3392 [Mucilaginibacter gracilis]
MQFHFKETRPWELSDDDWIENIRRLEWLAEKGILGVKEKK